MTPPLRRSPLHAQHVVSGAKLAEFGGWEMPIAYPSGTLAEHRACRSDAAVFDVSHLGTLRVQGTGAFEALQRAFTNDLGRIGPGQAQYTHLLDQRDAAVLDDLIVWWRSEQCFDVMPNASNTSRVEAALDGVGSGVGFDAADVTSERAVLAIQGPAARKKLAVTSPAAASVGRFRVVDFDWLGVSCVAYGTGYTGEDGVEIAVPREAAGDLWSAVVSAGVTPAGLGARDTLRLEAGLPLHGHELGPGITPLQAGLGWVVRWDKGSFIGRDALVAERETGVRRVLVGLLLEGRQPARENCDVVRLGDGRTVGRISSGNYSPMLERAISLAFLEPAESAIGTSLGVRVRDRMLNAQVVALPFVSATGE